MTGRVADREKDRLSLAAGLRSRGVAVEVHEAGSYPRHRVCGEFISGVETSTLEALGIRADFDDALRHRSVTDRPGFGHGLTAEVEIGEMLVV